MYVLDNKITNLIFFFLIFFLIFFFRKQAEMEGNPLLVQCVEVPGVEHRDMLSDDSVFQSILEFVGEYDRNAKE